MRYVIMLLAILAVSSAAWGAQKALVFGGEEFRKGFESATPDGGKIVELVRKQDSVQKWGKLLAFRYQKRGDIANNPNAAAIELGRLVRGSNPQAGFTVIKGTDEALVDYVTWPRHRKYAEFSVVRYIKSPDGKGLVSLKFGYRFSDTSPEGIAKFKRQRLSWLKEVAGFDIRKVNSALTD